MKIENFKAAQGIARKEGKLDIGFSNRNRIFENKKRKALLSKSWKKQIIW